jgi:hypothetical protein
MRTGVVSVFRERQQSDRLFDPRNPGYYRVRLDALRNGKVVLCGFYQAEALVLFAQRHMLNAQAIPIYGSCVWVVESLGGYDGKGLVAR